MTDLKISELPAATALADTDLSALVQSTPSNTTRRASVAQLRRQVLTDRGVDVRDFGAVGNGVANDAPAIQAAINALGPAGGTVNLGPRTYRLASAITISNTSVRLRGQGFQEGGSPGTGTWLTVDQTGFTPFTFTGAAARGSVVANLAVREAHNAAQTSTWAPTNYDWFFRIQDCFGGVDFDNVLLSGVNRGIFCRNSGRLDIRRLRGQVFTAGIEIDECYDVPRIMNLHFWPFWSANNNVVRWQQNNGDCIIMRRSDGIFVDQAFVLGYRTMFRFNGSAAGVTTKFAIGQAYADFVRHGLLVEGAGTNGQIDSLTVQCELFGAGGPPINAAASVFINAHSTSIQIANLRCDDADPHAIRVAQYGNRLDVGALMIRKWNPNSNGSAAIQISDSGANPPNEINLRSDPILLLGNGGPVVNSDGNGRLGLRSMGGTSAKPGISVGQYGTGLFLPGPGALGMTANGLEVLRASSGSVTFGGPPGAEGASLVRPPGTSNHPQLQAAAAGNPAHVGWRAAGASANIGAVVGAPKGNGALLAHFPDNAVAGGNLRGQNAVDLQTSRDSNWQVASGNFAVMGGGQGNAASGVWATASGGFRNIVSAGLSWVPGGANANTRSQQGIGAWGAGAFTANGDAQSCERVYRRITADATVQALTQDTGAPSIANSYVLPDNSTVQAKLLVVAQQTGGGAGAVGDCAVWELTCLLRRGAGAATVEMVGGWRHADATTAVTNGAALAPTRNTAGAGAWRVSLSANASIGGVVLNGTGEANKVIRWVARISSVEVVA